MAAIDEIMQLLSAEQTARDADWYKKFENALMSLPVQKPNPLQPGAIPGPDRLNYLVIRCPVELPDSDFKSILPDLAEIGCGVAFDFGNHHYVLHYGDIWSLHEYGFFYKPRATADAEPVDAPAPENLNLFKVPNSTRIIIGCPSDHYLPHYVKKNISHQLAHLWNIHNTGVASVYIRDMNPRQNLVFSIKQRDFSSPGDFKAVMNFLAWSLPKHYGLLWNELDDEKRPYLVGDADFYPLTSLPQ